MDKQAKDESRFTKPFLSFGKKGQGRTFWIVVTAVVALVVLIILLVIFTGKTGKLELGLLSCESKGGFCMSPTQSKSTATSSQLNGDCTSKCSSQGYTSCSYSSAFSCTKDTEICCVGIKKSS